MFKSYSYVIIVKQIVFVCFWIYNYDMRILGLDPGIAIVGYSIIDVDGDVLNFCASGSIRTSKNLSDSERLFEIAQDMDELIKLYSPDVAAVEKLFFFKNQKTVIPVAQARGVILMSLAKNGISYGEYTPIEVKQTITGYGRAEKSEVAEAVERMVEKNGNKWPKLDDTVDSIAIAVCHARYLQCSLASYET